MPQITHTEGKSNSSEARKTWLKEAIRPKSLPLMKRDADVFLHQSLFNPCVSTIAKAEGIWTEDLDGRRYTDFHGNSVHFSNCPATPVLPQCCSKNPAPFKLP